MVKDHQISEIKKIIKAFLMKRSFCTGSRVDRQRPAARGRKVSNDRNLMKPVYIF